jgi:hypothetical protein
VIVVGYFLIGRQQGWQVPGYCYKVELRTPSGAPHPLLSDVPGCYNTRAEAEAAATRAIEGEVDRRVDQMLRDLERSLPH